MKKLSLFWMILISLLVLMGCSSHVGCSDNSSSSDRNPDCTPEDLLKETWISKVNTDPKKWTRSADHWFLTGQPYTLEGYKTVPVSPFSNISVTGNFRVQIIGHQDHPGVYITGPRAAVNQVSIKTAGNTLYLRQTTNNANLDNVVIRIGLNQLNRLTYVGGATVSGHNIGSSGLTINSSGYGTIILSGDIKLSCISQTGTGTVTLLGVNSPNVDIKAMGNGNVNIYGRVGIQNVTHVGNGTVSIIGADTNSLKIMTGGNGLTTIVGYSHLKKLIAQDNSRLYIYWVTTNNAYIVVKDTADVGLAGAAGIINVDLSGSARFKGQYLHADYVYVNTRDSAHATVSGNKKIFASAMGSSSIYYFGPASALSSYTAQDAVVLPVGDGSGTLPTAPIYPASWSTVSGP